MLRQNCKTDYDYNKQLRGRHEYVKNNIKITKSRKGSTNCRFFTVCLNRNIGLNEQNMVRGQCI